VCGEESGSLQHFDHQVPASFISVNPTLHAMMLLAYHPGNRRNGSHHQGIRAGQAGARRFNDQIRLQRTTEPLQ
jgi:hypothetical protein